MLHLLIKKCLHVIYSNELLKINRLNCKKLKEKWYAYWRAITFDLLLWFLMVIYYKIMSQIFTSPEVYYVTHEPKNDFTV